MRSSWQCVAAGEEGAGDRSLRVSGVAHPNQAFGPGGPICGHREKRVRAMDGTRGSDQLPAFGFAGAAGQPAETGRTDARGELP